MKLLHLATSLCNVASLLVAGTDFAHCQDQEVHDSDHVCGTDVTLLQTSVSLSVSADESSGQSVFYNASHTGNVSFQAYHQAPSLPSKESNDAALTLNLTSGKGDGEVLLPRRRHYPWASGWHQVIDYGVRLFPEGLSNHHVEKPGLSLGPSSDDIDDDVQEYAKDVLLPVSGVFIASVMIGSFLAKLPGASHIPECATTVAIAMLLGLVLRQHIFEKIYKGRTIEVEGYVSQEDIEIVDSRVLQLFLLPIIMFNGGWSVRINDFFNQFEYILIFAIGGTLLTTLVFSVCSFFAANSFGLHPITGIRENLVFGALIGATDPVAILSVFGKMRMADRQPLLNTLVAGESLLNDAVAIALFRSLNFNENEAPGGASVVGRMLLLLVGSVAVGVVVASGFAFILRMMSIPGHTEAKVCVTFMSAYFTYAAAEAMDLSGIIASLFAGIVFKNYGAKHLTEEGEVSADRFFSTAAHAADTGVFLVCGTSVAFLQGNDWVSFFLVASFCVMLARAVAVLFCSSATNCLKSVKDERPTTITWKHQIMIWIAGIRGGIALVLTFEIGTWCDYHHRDIMIDSVFGVICFLLLTHGGCCEFMLMCLGLSEEGEKAADSLSEDKHPDGFTRKFGTKLNEFFNYLLVGDIRDSRAAAKPIYGEH